MSKSVRIAKVVLVVAAIATIGLIVVGVRQSLSYACEACITFEGRTACREAKGASRQEATSTAIQNACAFLASGMTRTIQCQNTPPDSATCQN